MMMTQDRRRAAAGRGMRSFEVAKLRDIFLQKQLSILMALFYCSHFSCHIEAAADRRYMFMMMYAL